MDWELSRALLLRKIGKMTGIRAFKARRTATLEPLDAGTLIERLLLSDEPAMICRWGSVEHWIAWEYLLTLHHFQSAINPHRFYDLCHNAGFFPDNLNMAEHCAQVLVESAHEADCIAAWNASYLPFEHYILHHCSPHARYVPLQALSPCENTPPWSRALKGKKVAVVHPFAESIQEQYQRRELLFDNPETLPEFELHTIKAVQGLNGEQTGFATWFDALHSMEEQLDATDYEIALIGAGAFGMPLAAHVKRRGKKAVHVGGALQLLFGIMGKRWQDSNAIIGMRSENWITPKQDERPASYQKVEGGCYW